MIRSRCVRSRPFEAEAFVARLTVRALGHAIPRLPKKGGGTLMVAAGCPTHFSEWSSLTESKLQARKLAPLPPAPNLTKNSPDSSNRLELQ